MVPDWRHRIRKDYGAIRDRHGCCGTKVYIIWRVPLQVKELKTSHCWGPANLNFINIIGKAIYGCHLCPPSICNFKKLNQNIKDVLSGPLCWPVRF